MVAIGKNVVSVMSVAIEILVGSLNHFVITQQAHDIITPYITQLPGTACPYQTLTMFSYFIVPIKHDIEP